jgi:hypothetical protein
MKNFLEDIKTFVGEVIGLIGGLFWGYKADWDYEPVILILISLAGILIFFLIKVIPHYDERPIVELEMVHTRTIRGPKTMIPNKSPRNSEGKYLQETDGIYLFEFEYFFN